MSGFEDFGPDNPLIMSGAGLCKTTNPATVQPFAQAADFAVVGSITLNARAGNHGIREDFSDPLYGLNAYGMPNPGIDCLADQAPADNLIVSLAGFDLPDWRQLIKAASPWGFGIELNFGCPNIRDTDSQQKAIISFDPDMIARILLAARGIRAVSNSRTIIGVKLSPYSDPGLLREVAAVINESRIVDYVATCNTFPNGVGFNDRKKFRVFTEEAGPYGGISGQALKPISLSNAAQLCTILDERIAVIRVGGISTGLDVWESYRAGCKGVQIVTAAMHGTSIGKVVQTIRQEYADVVSG